MRALFLPLLVASAPVLASGPSKFAVVVHTTDQVVAKYICDEDPTKEPFVYKTQLRKSGGFFWHVVGGTAPYTIVKDEMVIGDTRCITVMDAEGEVATACGIMGTVEILVREGCGELEELDHPWMGITPDSLSDSRRGPEFNGQGQSGQEDAIKDAPGQVKGPIGYKPPVKQTMDPVDPPVTKPDLSRVKPERQRNGGTTGTNPPPTTRPTPTPAPNPVRSSGTTFHGGGGGTTTTPTPRPAPGQGAQHQLHR